MSKEIDRIQKAWDKEEMTGPCHYCTAKKDIDELLSSLEDTQREIERLKVEIQKYKMFIKNYPSIIGNIIKEAVEELEKETK